MLQFMPICRDKPRFASNLEGLGVERLALSDENDSQTPGASQPLQQQQQDLRVAPGALELATPENGFTSKSVGPKNRSQDPNSPEFVERKVKALLNKITPRNFDSISSQVANWVNSAEGEKSGAVLDLVTKLMLEQAAATPLFSEMFARMSRKMMEKCSASIRDGNSKNGTGEPIVGGHLFRKYLLSRCKEHSELCWTFLRAGATDPSTQDHKSEGQPTMFSDEYYAICKAKREGLNLTRFTGELFKVQLLTERLMHETIKQLLGKINDTREEEIERLCILLATIGQKLDTPKAKGHVNVYFGKMEKSVDSNKLSPRLRWKLLDVIELRERNWIPRGTVLESPATIHLHPQGVKEAHGTTQERQADKPTPGIA